jgi:hypothetical protein
VGLTSLQQLLAVSETDVEALLCSYGLLRGHAMKIRAALQGIRNGPLPASDPLVAETERVVGKLREIDGVSMLLNRSKERIMAVDTEGIRKTLDAIEILQADIRTELEESKRVQSTPQLA